MRKSILIGLVLGVALFGRLAAEEWAKHLVDNEGAVGEQCRMALDAQGNPHLVYLVSASDSLYYVRWTGSGWTAREYITLSAYDPDIVVDEAGKPHVAVKLSNLGGDLYYYTKPSDQWVGSLVFGTTYTRLGCTIALDSLSRPHVVHKQRYLSTNKLYHTYYDGSSWNNEFVTDVAPGDWCSIAIDTNDCIYVAFNTAAAHLKCATNCGSGWSEVYVDTATGVGAYCDLALDDSGQPYIAYYDSTNGNLKCAVPVPGAATTAEQAAEAGRDQ